MAEDWQLIEIVSEPVMNTPCFHMRLRKPNGEDIIHVIPQATLDIRAAEYDIDHTTLEGKAQVIDIILHEHHGPPPTHLGTKPSIDEARKAHLAQCEENKSQRVNVVWSGNPRAKGSQKLAKGVDPAKTLLDHPVNPQLVKMHKDRVLVSRWHRGLQDIPDRLKPNPRGPVGGAAIASLLDLPRE